MNAPTGRTDPAHHPALPGWVIARATCPSTNTWALDHLDRLRHGDCVWTEHQSAGRGRDGRVWRSPPGVLTASFVIDLQRADTSSAVPTTRLSLATGLAICHAVTDTVGPGLARLKWPNDVLIHERKLAGVLCETRQRSDQSQVAVIGIGCNLAPQWDFDGASLPLASGRNAPIGLDEVGTPPAAVAMLGVLRRYLLEATGLLSTGTWLPLLAAIRTHDALYGRPIRVETPTAVLTGRAAGIADDGALRIDTGSDILSVASGHVSLC